MTRAGLLLLVAACGSSTPPPKPPEPPVAVAPTRVPVEDEDDNDNVSFIGSRGKMDLGAIEEGIAPHKQALSDCYLTNLKQRRWLGGQIILHWEIDKAGTVTSVRLDDTEEPGAHLGNWPMEKCILDVARQATFAKPVGGDADFQLPLEFAAKGKLAMWSADKALRAVGGQTVKLDACAKGKVTRPEDVTITLYVGPGGKAQSVGFTSTKSVIDDAWATCAEKAAMGWRLPDPRGVIAKLAVTYH